jgi:aspartate kinase
VLSSVTVDEDLAVIRVTGDETRSQIGVVRTIVDLLDDEHIHVYDVITSATSVSMFVDWGDREEALELIQNAF